MPCLAVLLKGAKRIGVKSLEGEVAKVVKEVKVLTMEGIEMVVIMVWC